MKSTTDTITDILEDKLGISPTEVTPDANLIKDLGIDSLDYAEIVMEFEQVFDIKIPDTDAELFETIKDAVNYIDQKRKAS